MYFIILFIFVITSFSTQAMDPMRAFLNKSPLHTAVLRRDIASIKATLKNGIAQEIHDEYGLIEIIDHVGIAALNLQDEHGQTALHIAARKNYLKELHLLIKMGASLDICDKEGRTPAFVAAHYGRVRALGVLLTDDDCLAITKSGKRLMHLAVLATHGKPLATISYLAECGLSVNQLDALGNTPLHDALRSGAAREVIFLLLKHGANPTARDGNNITPYALDTKGYIAQYELANVN